jgi:hypothetical protein
MSELFSSLFGCFGPLSVFINIWISQSINTHMRFAYTVLREKKTPKKIMLVEVMSVGM